MPSGPKKRKAAKRKKEALSIHVDDSSVASIPSPGNGCESSGEMASPMTSEGREVEAAEAETCELGMEIGSVDALENGEPVAEAVEEQPTRTQKAEEIGEASGVEAHEVKGDVSIPKAEGESVDEPAGDQDDCIGDSGVGIVEELRKSVYAAEPSCTIERPVPLIEEVKSSEVQIEKIGESVSVEVETEVEQLGKIDASSSADPALAPGKQEEKVVSLSGAPTKQPPSEREAGNEVALPLQAAHRTSWMSCCGLFDAFTASNG